MGLLFPEERNTLVDLLVRLPNIAYPLVRQQLLPGIPLDIQVQISAIGASKPDLISMVNEVDNENWDEPYQGSWPVLQLIKNAKFLVGKSSPLGQKLQALLDVLILRSEQREELATLQLTHPSSLDPVEFERVTSKMVSFHDPVLWAQRMRQQELAVCLISFEDPLPKAQGTGFLVGPDLVMTAYHVMQPVYEGNVDPHKVKLRFDYKETADKTRRQVHPEYCLAPDWLIDFSTERQLDYVLTRTTGMPGLESIEGSQGTVQRKWLVPRSSYPFQPGEYLFIMQHPYGGFLKFALDRIKRLSATRISYLTNTDHGSSGSPCFTINWELVALHHGVVKKGIDPDLPNEGIPFSAILQQSRVRDTLAQFLNG
jgi:hypothetical protein